MTIRNSLKICDNCQKETVFSEYCLFHFNKQRHFCNKECFLEWIKKYLDFLVFAENEESKK